MRDLKLSPKQATLIGLIAILLWSGIVGLIRKVSENFGAVNGAALIYSFSAILLLIFFGIPKIKKTPILYIIVGCLLFISYELCLSLSLGYAQNSSQAIEVGMINYLWPSLTIILSLVFEKKKMRWPTLLGILISIIGVCQVLGGEHGFSIEIIVNNLCENPVSYGLAFLGAVIWSVYCVITRKYADGYNGISVFFSLTALTLWIKYFTGPQASFIFSWSATVSLILASAAMAFGYAAWNIGILRGNVTVLATASYFIPVLSAALASLILASVLTLSFWKGSLMVSLGSLICWLSTRENNQKIVIKRAKIMNFRRKK